MTRDERTLASVNLRLGFTTVSNAFAAAFAAVVITLLFRESWPDRPLELRVDGRVTPGEFLPVLASLREAGYSEFYVFDRERSILQWIATDRRAT